MAVPTTGEDLDKADAFFDQAAGHEALAPEVVGGLVIHAIHVADVLRFTVEIDDFWDFHLHAVSEFIRLHARGKVGMFGMLAGVFVIEAGEGIERGALVVARFERL